MKHFTDETILAATYGLTSDQTERLKIYAELLVKWQPRINLVGPDTLPDLWHRHMADSVQLWPMIASDCRRLVDLGSGAGFPGLVLAILGVADVHLIESDQRKGAFLREVARATDTKISLHSDRIEKVAPLEADVVTARALAPLVKLWPWVKRHLKPGGYALLPKGRNAEEELTEAAKESTLRIARTVSATDPHSVVFRIEEVQSGAEPV